MKEDLSHSIESEQTVLGGILVTEGRSLPEVAAVLRPEEFFHPLHRAIFEAMLGLDGKRQPVNSLSVLEALKASRSADQMRHHGGDSFLVDLMVSCVTVENLAWHAERIAGKAHRRRWREAAIRIAGLAAEGSDDDEVLEQAENLALETMNRRRAERAVKLTTILRQLHKDIESRAERKTEVTGIPTSFPDLDLLTAGLQLQDLIIIAARPSIGKTALALNIVQGASAAKVPCLVFSLEMQSSSLAERLVAAQGNLNSRRLKTGQLRPPGEFITLSQATSDLSVRPIWIDDSGGISIQDVRSRARRWAAREAADAPMRLIVIDYLQLLSGGPQRGRDQNREREIAEISRGLKMLAKETNSAVLALSQLSRALEGRADKRPMLSDLRESGAIEQDADVVAFLYREEVYDPKTEDKGIAELIVAKQRSGSTETIRLGWHRETTRFSHLAAPEPQQPMLRPAPPVRAHWQDARDPGLDSD